MARHVPRVRGPFVPRSFGPSILRDVTAPGPNISVSPSSSRISRVAGRNQASFSFTVDEPYQAYQLRAVPADTSPVTSGTLIEAGEGGPADTNRSVDITGDELATAGLGEGLQLIKVFAQDSAGNWST